MLTLLLILLQSAAGQLSKEYKDKFLEADFNFLTQDYTKALNQYENLLVVDPYNGNLNYMCGLCCTKIPGKDLAAIKFFKEAICNIDPGYKGGSYKETHAPPVAYLLLANSYHRSERFDDALQYYRFYRDSTGLSKLSEIEFVNHQMKSCEMASVMVRNPLTVKLENILDAKDQNYSRCHPLISGNDSTIVFLEFNESTRQILMVSRKKDEWTQARIINIELGVSADFYPTALSFDGSELYLVHKDIFNSDIYVSKYENNRWKKAVPLGRNVNSRYNETHASISSDGLTLFFTSNRKGGHGGLDIYRSSKNPDGSWNEAENLGATINTIYNEETPFLSRKDTKLYFSSEGHKTMGGYDIFFAEIKETGKWTEPENLGYPINSVSDDLFYNPGWKDMCGYYAWSEKGQDKRELKMINLVNEGSSGSEQYSIQPLLP